MGTFKLNYVKDNCKVELEMDGYDSELIQYMVDKIIESPSSDNPTDDLEKFIAAGYSCLENNVEGLHSPESEFTIPEIIEESLKEVAPALETVDIPKQEENVSVSEKKQLWYICSCGNKGKHYITPQRKYVTCHACPEKMMVRLANNAGPDHADEYGNHFIAGEFRKTMKSIEDEQKFWETYNERH